jgi:hypothetical protein
VRSRGLTVGHALPPPPQAERLLGWKTAASSTETYKDGERRCVWLCNLELQVNT